MFCTNCGTKVDESAMFCDECGARIEREENEIPAPTIPSAPIPSAPMPTAPMPVVIPVPIPAPVAARTATQPIMRPIPTVQRKAKKSLPGWAIGLIIVLAVVVLVLGVGAALLATGVISFDGLTGKINAGKTQTEAPNNSEGNAASNATSEGVDTDDASSPDTDAPENDGSANGEGVYIISDSASRRLSESDLQGLSDDELSIAQNEIWARHGRMFKNQWLQSYFNAQGWYKGTIPADEFLDHYTPTATEDANASLINSVLSSHGYDVNRAHPN